METVTINGTTKQIPSYLEELTTEQYCSYLELWNYSIGDILVFREYWFRKLLGLSLEIRLYKKKVQNEFWNQIGKIDGFFLWEGKECKSVIVNTTKNMIPKLGIWEGYGDMLSGMKFGDFCDCLNLLSTTDKMKDEIYARHTYKPEEFDAIRKLRIQFFEKMYHDTSDDGKGKNYDFDDLALLIRHSTIFFGSVWDCIMHNPIEINSQMIDFSILFNSQNSGKYDDDHTGMSGIAFEVAKSGVFGNMKQLNESDLWDVLLYLYKCKFEYIHSKTKQS